MDIEGTSERRMARGELEKVSAVRQFRIGVGVVVQGVVRQVGNVKVKDT